MQTDLDNSSYFAAFDQSNEETCWSALADVARSLDLPDEAKWAIAEGIRRHSWAPILELFLGAGPHEPRYLLARMRTINRPQYSLGFLALEPVPDLFNCLDAVQRVLPGLGEALFHRPLVPCDRLVEFLRVRQCLGPFTGRSRDFAIFTPGMVDLGYEPMTPVKRRVSFLLEKCRQRFVTPLRSPEVSAILRRSGFIFPDAMEANVDEALAIWLFLHETIHCNGPIPLYEPKGIKSSLGARIGCFEEFRVDLTVFVVARLFPDRLGHAARLTAELIVANRVFGSAALLASPFGQNSRDRVEGLHGLLWVQLALFGEALRLQDDEVAICLEAIGDASMRYLTDWYAFEESMIAHDGARDVLLAYSRSRTRELRDFYSACRERHPCLHALSSIHARLGSVTAT